MKYLITVFCLIASTWTALNAQFGQSQDVLTVEAFLSVDKIRPGDKFKIGVRAILNNDWHINSNKPSEDFLIPTLVEFESANGLEFGEIHYPDGGMKTFEFSETPLSVYEGSVVVWADVKASTDIDAGEIKILGKFSYQACNDVQCLIPSNEPFEILSSVVEKGSPITKINAESFLKKSSELGELQGDRSTNVISELFAGSGLLLTFGFIFLSGLALNLTPCVYPIIPITVSFFVGQASGKISRSFFLALIYVFGMSITYSALGVIAAMTGGLLGSSLQSPFVLIAIAAIFVIFAASMFGAFEIKVPAFLSNFAGGSKQGIAGSLFMGLTVGIVAAPCIGPFVLSLLTYVAAKGDPFTGFLLFFILSMGLGLPYLFLGTFSSSIRSLPKSGEWMIWVKKVFGVVMVAVAIYFVNPLLANSVYVVLLTATAIIGGAVVGFFDKSKASFSLFKGLKPTVGTLLVLFGVWTSVSAWTDANLEHFDWQNYDDELVAQAKEEGKPILIDFFADWCIPCRQIEKKLFTAPAIVEKSKDFLALKADLTQEKSAAVLNLRKKYQVLGVPTVILINSEGKEYRRFTDELLKLPHGDFLAILDDAFVQPKETIKFKVKL